MKICFVVNSVETEGAGTTVIEAIEKKVEYKKLYGSGISNRELATIE